MALREATAIFTKRCFYETNIASHDAGSIPINLLSQPLNPVLPTCAFAIPAQISSSGESSALNSETLWNDNNSQNALQLCA